MNFKKGFTLIELLVVVAIIGILASVVLASLNNARSKGSDAAIKADMTNARAQAELFYASNSNSYLGVCAAAALTDGTKSINSLVDGARVAGGFGTTLQILSTDVGAFDKTTCHAISTAWAAESPLKASASGAGNAVMFCVDSTGAAKTNSSALGNGATAC